MRVLTLAFIFAVVVARLAAEPVGVEHYSTIVEVHLTIVARNNASNVALSFLRDCRGAAEMQGLPRAELLGVLQQLVGPPLSARAAGALNPPHRSPLTAETMAIAPSRCASPALGAVVFILPPASCGVNASGNAAASNACCIAANVTMAHASPTKGATSDSTGDDFEKFLGQLLVLHDDAACSAWSAAARPALEFGVLRELINHGILVEPHWNRNSSEGSDLLGALRNDTATSIVAVFPSQVHTDLPSSHRIVDGLANDRTASSFVEGALRDLFAASPSPSPPSSSASLEAVWEALLHAALRRELSEHDEQQEATNSAGNTTTTSTIRVLTEQSVRWSTNVAWWSIAAAALFAVAIAVFVSCLAAFLHRLWTFRALLLSDNLVDRSVMTSWDVAGRATTRRDTADDAGDAQGWENSAGATSLSTFDGGGDAADGGGGGKRLFRLANTMSGSVASRLRKRADVARTEVRSRREEREELRREQSAAHALSALSAARSQLRERAMRGDVIKPGNRHDVALGDSITNTQSLWIDDPANSERNGNPATAVSATHPPGSTANGLPAAAVDVVDDLPREAQSHHARRLRSADLLYSSATLVLMAVVATSFLLCGVFAGMIAAGVDRRVPSHDVMLLDFGTLGGATCRGPPRRIARLPASGHCQRIAWFGSPGSLGATTPWDGGALFARAVCEKSQQEGNTTVRAQLAIDTSAQQCEVMGHAATRGVADDVMEIVSGVFAASQPGGHTAMMDPSLRLPCVDTIATTSVPLAPRHISALCVPQRVGKAIERLLREHEEVQQQQHEEEDEAVLLNGDESGNSTGVCEAVQRVVTSRNELLLSSDWVQDGPLLLRQRNTSATQALHIVPHRPGLNSGRLLLVDPAPSHEGNLPLAALSAGALASRWQLAPNVASELHLWAPVRSHRNSTGDRDPQAAVPLGAHAASAAMAVGSPQSTHMTDLGAVFIGGTTIGAPAGGRTAALLYERAEGSVFDLAHHSRATIVLWTRLTRFSSGLLFAVASDWSETSAADGAERNVVAATLHAFFASGRSDGGAGFGKCGVPPSFKLHAALRADGRAMTLVLHFGLGADELVEWDLRQLGGEHHRSIFDFEWHLLVITMRIAGGYRQFHLFVDGETSTRRAGWRQCVDAGSGWLGSRRGELVPAPHPAPHRAGETAQSTPRFNQSAVLRPSSAVLIVGDRFRAAEGVYGLQVIPDVVLSQTEIVARTTPLIQAAIASSFAATWAVAGGLMAALGVGVLFGVWQLRGAIAPPDAKSDHLSESQRQRLTEAGIDQGLTTAGRASANAASAATATKRTAASMRAGRQLRGAAATSGPSGSLTDQAATAGKALIPLIAGVFQAVAVWVSGWDWPASFRNAAQYVLFIFAFDLDLAFPEVPSITSPLVQFFGGGLVVVLGIGMGFADQRAFIRAATQASSQRDDSSDSEADEGSEPADSEQASRASECDSVTDGGGGNDESDDDCDDRRNCSNDSQQKRRRRRQSARRADAEAHDSGDGVSGLLFGFVGRGRKWFDEVVTRVSESAGMDVIRSKQPVASVADDDEALGIASEARESASLHPPHAAVLRRVAPRAIPVRPSTTFIFAGTEAHFFGFHQAQHTVVRGLGASVARTGKSSAAGAGEGVERVPCTDRSWHWRPHSCLFYSERWGDAARHFAVDVVQMLEQMIADPDAPDVVLPRVHAFTGPRAATKVKRQAVRQRLHDTHFSVWSSLSDLSFDFLMSLLHRSAVRVGLAPHVGTLSISVRRAERRYSIIFTPDAVPCSSIGASAAAVTATRSWRSGSGLVGGRRRWRPRLLSGGGADSGSSAAIDVNSREEEVVVRVGHFWRCPHHKRLLIPYDDEHHSDVKTCSLRLAPCISYARGQCSNSVCLVCPDDTCGFGLCTACGDDPPLPIFLLQVLHGKVYTLRKHNIGVLLGIIVILLAQVLFLPIVKSAVMVLACHVDTHCEFPWCFRIISSKFAVGIFLAASSLLGCCFVLLPVFWYLLAQRKAFIIDHGLVASAHVQPSRYGRFFGKVAATCDDAEWSMFLHSDRSVLRILYEFFEFRFMTIFPVALIFKILALLPIVALEANSLAQIVVAGIVEALQLIFITATRAYINPWLDMLARAGSFHQLALLSLSALSRRYTTGSIATAMVAVSLGYLGILAAVIVHEVVIPLATSLGEKRQREKRRARRNAVHHWLQAAQEAATRDAQPHVREEEQDESPSIGVHEERSLKGCLGTTSVLLHELCFPFEDSRYHSMRHRRPMPADSDANAVGTEMGDTLSKARAGGGSGGASGAARSWCLCWCCCPVAEDPIKGYPMHLSATAQLCLAKALEIDPEEAETFAVIARYVRRCASNVLLRRWARVRAASDEFDLRIPTIFHQLPPTATTLKTLRESFLTISADGEVIFFDAGQQQELTELAALRRAVELDPLAARRYVELADRVAAVLGPEGRVTLRAFQPTPLDLSGGVQQQQQQRTQLHNVPTRADASNVVRHQRIELAEMRVCDLLCAAVELAPDESENYYRIVEQLDNTMAARVEFGDPAPVPRVTLFGRSCSSLQVLELLVHAAPRDATVFVAISKAMNRRIQHRLSASVTLWGRTIASAKEVLAGALEQQRFGAVAELHVALQGELEAELRESERARAALVERLSDDFGIAPPLPAPGEARAPRRLKEPTVLLRGRPVTRFGVAAHFIERNPRDLNGYRRLAALFASLHDTAGGAARGPPRARRVATSGTPLVDAPGELPGTVASPRASASASDMLSGGKGQVCVSLFGRTRGSDDVMGACFEHNFDRVAFFEDLPHLMSPHETTSVQLPGMPHLEAWSSLDMLEFAIAVDPGQLRLLEILHDVLTAAESPEGASLPAGEAHHPHCDDEGSVRNDAVLSHTATALFASELAAAPSAPFAAVPAGIVINQRFVTRKDVFVVGAEARPNDAAMLLRLAQSLAVDEVVTLQGQEVTRVDVLLRAVSQNPLNTAFYCQLAEWMVDAEERLRGLRGRPAAASVEPVTVEVTVGGAACKGSDNDTSPEQLDATTLLSRVIERIDATNALLFTCLVELAERRGVVFGRRQKDMREVIERRLLRRLRHTATLGISGDNCSGGDGSGAAPIPVVSSTLTAPRRSSCEDRNVDENASPQSAFRLYSVVLFGQKRKNAWDILAAGVDANPERPLFYNLLLDAVSAARGTGHPAAPQSDDEPFCRLELVMAAHPTELDEERADDGKADGPVDGAQASQPLRVRALRQLAAAHTRTSRGSESTSECWGVGAVCRAAVMASLTRRSERKAPKRSVREICEARRFVQEELDRLHRNAWKMCHAPE